MKRQVGKLEGERRVGQKVWCSANQNAATHPLWLCVPPSSSSWTPPPFPVLGEHADSRLCVCGGVWEAQRAGERGTEISYSSRGKAGRRASDLGTARVKVVWVAEQNYSKKKRILSIQTQFGETGEAVRGQWQQRQTDRQGTPGPSRALSFSHRKLLSQFLQSLTLSLAAEQKQRGCSCACCELRGACLTAWRLWAWPRGPSMMCPDKALACWPRPPLTSPAWIPSPGPGPAAAFSVSTPSCPSDWKSSVCVCVCVCVRVCVLIRVLVLLS